MTTLYSPAEEAALNKVLATLLAEIEPLLLERDAQKLLGDVRKAKALQARINDLIASIHGDPGLDAIGGPLGEMWSAGAISVSGTGLQPVSEPRARDARATFGGSVVRALDKDAIRHLAAVVADPYAAALSNAKSPLPYIAPRLDVEKQRLVAEISLEGKVRGQLWKQIARNIQAALPEAARPIENMLDAGPQVELESGYRMPADNYAMMLARTQSMWAANKGVLDTSKDLGIETVQIVKNLECVDFCLDFEGCVFALTDAAAQRYNLPLLTTCPNGGPPLHPNCRHSLAPIALLKKDRGGPDGNIQTIPKDSRTGELGKGKSGPAAQLAFVNRRDKDPLQYAPAMAEHAREEGFGGKEIALKKGWYRSFIGQKIPGKKEVFGARALSEDAHLAKRMQEGVVSSRKEYRQITVDTLHDYEDVRRKGTDLYYHAKGWAVGVDAKTGLVLTSFKLEGTWEEYIAKKGLQ